MQPEYAELAFIMHEKIKAIVVFYYRGSSMARAIKIILFYNVNRDFNALNLNHIIHNLRA